MKPTQLVLVLAGVVGAYFLMRTAMQPRIAPVRQTGPIGSAGGGTAAALIGAGASIVNGLISRIGAGGSDDGGGDVPDPDFEIMV